MEEKGSDDTLALPEPFLETNTKDAENVAGKEGNGTWIVLLLVVSVWLLACSLLGWRENRIDLTLWGCVAILPSVIFFIYVGNQYKCVHRIPPWKIGLICGTAALVYIFIMITEVACVFFMYAIQGSLFPAFSLETSSWWLNLILIGIFSFMVPATMEEAGKMIICLVNTNKQYVATSTVTRITILRNTSLETILISMTGAITLGSIENMQYVISTFYGSKTCCTPPLQMFLEVILRDMFSVTLHVSTGALIGSQVGAVLSSQKTLYSHFPSILSLPIVLHGTFDAALIWSSVEVKQTHQLWFSAFNIVAFIVVLFSAFLALIKFQRAKQESQKEQSKELAQFSSSFP